MLLVKHCLTWFANKDHRPRTCSLERTNKKVTMLLVKHCLTWFANRWKPWILKNCSQRLGSAFCKYWKRI